MHLFSFFLIFTFEQEKKHVGVSKYRARMPRARPAALCLDDCRARTLLTTCRARTFLVNIHQYTVIVFGRISANKHGQRNIDSLNWNGSFKELCDPRQKEYHNKNKREDLWNEIANNFDLPKKELKMKVF